MNPDELEQVMYSQPNVPVERQEILLPFEEVNQTPVASASPATSEDVARHVLLDSHIAGIELTLLQLKEMFEQRLQYDAVKDRAFDTLYDKMKQYESGFQASLKESMIRSLVLLHDTMVNSEAELSATPKAQAHISYLRQELLDILYAEDVEPIGELSGQFNSSRQQALRTIPTDDPAQGNSIAEVIREGFLFQGKVLRPQSVIVRRYVGAATEVHGEVNQSGEYK
jgi:molecular chaperone GrpE